MSIHTYIVRCFGVAVLTFGLAACVERQADAAAFDQDGQQLDQPIAEADGEDFFGMTVGSPPERIWLRADYLYWWTSGMRLPALVTTSPQGTARSAAGVLPNATVLYGNQTVGDRARSGFRTTLGMWLDASHVWGVEFDYFQLCGQSHNFNRISTGNPILARPFYDVQAIAQASQVVAYPNEVSGAILVNSKDYFQSAGVLLTYNLCSSNPCCDICDYDMPLAGGVRTDLLIGFRSYNLDDRLGVVQDSVITEAGPTQGTAFLIQDNFRARNEFYGSELGLRTKMHRARWSFEILAKIAFGNNHQTVTIDGSTAIAAPGQPTQTYNAGTLAVGSNSGVYQNDVFTMIPQLGLELGYQVNHNWRAYFGYNVLFWDRVARSSSQVDLNLDPRNFAPATAGALPFPAFSGKTESFWAHGINLGLERRF